MEVSGSVSNPSAAEVFFSGMGEKERDRVRLKRKTLEAVLEQCHRALELLSCSGGGGDDDESDGMDEGDEERGEGSSPASGCAVDRETDELCDLIKSRVECPDFLERIEHAQALIPQNSIEDGSSWDIVNENDLWEDENIDADKGDYVLVRQEDIIEGIASFMAAYLLTLKQKKELTPNQLQDALSQTFSLKKKKGKLRKAWDGSKVIYNVASWSATAIGIYQNPLLLRAASTAFWTSCDAISKLF